MNDSPATVRILALHLTKPSNSEAKVVASLFSRLGPGFEVTLLVNAKGDGDAASHLRSLEQHPGIRVVHADVGLPIDPWTPPSGVRRLIARASHPWRRARLIRSLSAKHFDLVYTSQQRFDCRMGELAARRWDVPQVVHLHYTVGPHLRRPALRRLTTCDHVLAISDYIGRQVVAAGLPPERMTVLHNTMQVGEPVTRRRAASSDVVIGQVGRMFEGKGFQKTVMAFARLLEVVPTARLVLVGDGPERGEVERLVDAHGIGHAVLLTGWQANVGRWLDEIDVFMHPSVREPFGLAVMEAMARCLPVIAYGDAGVAEIIEDRVSGILVQPDDEDALARALIELATDADLRERIGRAGFDRIATAFNPTIAAGRFEKALADVLHRPGGNAGL